ncbi:MAG: translation initiation factor IF-3 [Acidobacteria bacterium]|nr:translation initiation factor IF-3 [Acidobacteriota bacterium]MBU4254396.1 translation initiation factor IF-3 [Acidobacteriota bacterium]MBU4329506.1 translation initiation factor IF-3 [Acidobacteriota bacterium]MBU4494756.1 translation initiation factor IF-3 [Acidobacteriota bacterium]
MRKRTYYPGRADKRKPHRINEWIRVREVRIIDEEKQQLGIMPIADAINLAKERGLDLVEVAPQANPPVCRVMDYGKFLYEQHKKAHEAKKHQKQIQVKEIKFRPKISIHDYTFKLNHVLRFLKEGNKVKITVMLRGREKAKPELAHQILDRVFEDTKEFGQKDGDIRRQSWAVSALLSPTKTGGKDAKVKDAQRGQKEVQSNGEKEDRS